MILNECTVGKVAPILTFWSFRAFRRGVGNEIARIARFESNKTADRRVQRLIISLLLAHFLCLPPFPTSFPFHFSTTKENRFVLKTKREWIQCMLHSFNVQRKIHSTKYCDEFVQTESSFSFKFSERLCMVSELRSRFIWVYFVLTDINFSAISFNVTM